MEGETMEHECVKHGGAAKIILHRGEGCPLCGFAPTAEDWEWAAIARVQAVFDETGPWVTLAEAARLIGANRHSLAQSARAGRLPAWNPAPGVWLVRKAAIKAGVGLFAGPGRPSMKVLHRPGAVIHKAKRIEKGRANLNGNGIK